MKNRKENFEKLNKDQLKVKVDNWRAELFSLRLTAATSHVKDNSQFRKLRKNIARALTFLSTHKEINGK